jgi:predicted DNA-binding transcriptional regulator AlpA
VTTPSEAGGPRYLRTADLRKLLPVRRTAFYELIKQPSFPTPIQLTDGGAYLWIADEVDKWLLNRPRVSFQAKAVRRQSVADQDELDLELVPVTGRRGAA